MKEKSRNILEYILLKISSVVLYRIVVVTFFEYLLQQAPIITVLLNYGSKLVFYRQYLKKISKTKTIFFVRESYAINVKTTCLVAS